MEKLKLIDRITDIIKLNGGFSVGEFDDDTNGVVVSELGKFVGIAEYFNEDCATINIYEPTSFSSDEVDNFEMKYEEMDDNVLQEILLICEKWDKKWGEENQKDTLEQVAERIVLETYNEAFSKFPRGGKVSNEALTDSLVLFFRLGSEWQLEQSKNLYSEEDLREAFRQGEQNISYSETYGLDSKLTEQQLFEQFQERIKSLDNNFKEQENTLEEIVIKNFNEEYIKIDLYDSNDNFIGKLDRNQYIDVRIQAYMKNIKGLYVVYPDGEKGFINHENGAVSYFQEGLWNTALRLSRLLMSLQSNDIKNQNRIIE